MNTKILLLIGPTAVGKSSLLEKALADYAQLVDIITFTTRPMRAGESEGYPYHFVSEEKFKALIDEGFFIEWALVHGRLYGTPRDQILEAGRNGKVILIDIDVQGAKTLAREFPNLVSVFLLPPSLDALRQRFLKRGVTDAVDLERRLQSAQVEMAQAGDFRHTVINDDFVSCYHEVRKIIENMLKNQ